MSSNYDRPDRRRPDTARPAPVSERRVYRSDRRDDRRSRMLALIVLVLLAIVIALTGVAAGSSAFDGSEDEAGSFKLLPISTTTT
jgi:hypothetical protein